MQGSRLIASPAYCELVMISSITGPVEQIPKCRGNPQHSAPPSRAELL
jgi:hypothetical protein